MYSDFKPKSGISILTKEQLLEISNRELLETASFTTSEEFEKRITELKKFIEVAKSKEIAVRTNYREFSQDHERIIREKVDARIKTDHVTKEREKKGKVIKSVIDSLISAGYSREQAEQFAKIERKG